MTPSIDPKEVIKVSIKGNRSQFVEVTIEWLSHEQLHSLIVNREGRLTNENNRRFGNFTNLHRDTSSREAESL